MNQVVQNHGVHNLEKKQSKLKINYTNRNDILNIIGPPSTKSSFNNDIYIYIEKKTSSSKLIKLGKKKLIVNNVLVLKMDDNGLLLSKNFYNKEDMKKIDFNKDFTKVNTTEKSFIYNFLYSLRQKIDDPLGKKRVKN
jgi:outer membrane protein assembly factor BamE (lipoprotein component of BamABCDE complex)